MEKRLLRMIAVLAALTIAGLLVLMPYRLYDRDTEVARQHARVVSDELSNMIKLTMLTTKEVLALNPNLSLGVVLEKINALYAKFGKNQDFDFRVIRSPLIENQFAVIKGRSADNTEAKQVLQSGRPESRIDGAILTYWSPIKADAECGHCHKDAEKKRVSEGTALGVVETVFDLTRERNRSIRTIIEITGFLVLMIAVMAVVAFAVIRKNLIEPLRGLVDILNLRAKDPETPLPDYASPEMRDLVSAIKEQPG
ncbi:MAG: hypothetical protein KDJ16_03830, partial [Hyphomicrobiales bacterium]|nr:hypothetical protein [Hyphomicrobiales bacterium]